MTKKQKIIHFDVCKYMFIKRLTRALRTLENSTKIFSILNGPGEQNEYNL